MHSLEEVGREADTVRSEIEQLCVRGLSSSTPADRKKLSQLAAEWERLGAGHVASRLSAAMSKADADAKDAPSALLSAYTSLHVFERVLSLEAAVEAWARHLQELEDAAVEGDEDEGKAAGGGGEEPVAAPAKAAPKPADKPPAAAPPIEDPKGALSLLEELSRAVEDLVRTGLTSATESTRVKLDASFKEASRRKLLRLGASLRFVNEDIARFLADDVAFSMRRFVFFLHRSWMQARGLAKGIRDKNDRVLSAILVTGGAAPRPLASIDVVTIGVLKRTIVNAHTFDFKLRVVGAKDTDMVGRALSFSLVFPRKKEPGKDPPAEAYLHLPQPQKFTPRILNQGKVVRVTDCAAVFDERGTGKLMLGPRSAMSEGEAYSGWAKFYRFDPAAALERARRAVPNPQDLAIEMQEEVFVSAGELSKEPLRTSEGRRIFGLSGAGGLTLDVVIPDNPYNQDGEETLTRLRAGLGSKSKPLLYGLAYYEFGRTMFLPLSLMKVGSVAKDAAPEPKPAAAKKKGAGKAGGDAKPAAKGNDAPDLITLSQKKFDVSALVGTLSF